MRRNEAPDTPIVLRHAEDVARWRERGAVEFLAEVGRSFESGYQVDVFLVDLDPQHGYPLEALRTLAGEVSRRLAGHEWVDEARVGVQWTGGKGFHIIAPFRDGSFRPVEGTKRVLETVIHDLVNDVSIFKREQPTLEQPYVILDLSPMMRRGVYRNAFSLHGRTGNVCVPVEPARLLKFDPEREATPAAVLGILERMGDCQGEEYSLLLPRFWRLGRETFGSSTGLPPVRAIPPRPRPPLAPVIRIEERSYQPSDWPPKLVVTRAQMEAILPAVAAGPWVALDLETTGLNPRADSIRLLSLAMEGRNFVVDCQAVHPGPILDALRGKRLVGHSISFDLAFLARRYGFTPAAVEDTMILSQLLHAGEERTERGFHSLGSVVRRQLG
jgi:hypothetical protein